MTMAATVRHYIEGRGVAYDRVAHPGTGSSLESARKAHVDGGHIAKAVMLHDSAGAVMAVVPGDSWVRLNAVNRELGRDLALAGEGEASGYFPDCAIGAIPPLGPAYGIETLLDDALASLAYVFFESGDHRTLIRVTGEGFLELLGGARHGRFCDTETGH